VDGSIRTVSWTDAFPGTHAVEPSFFDRPSDKVAPELIGMVLWREGVGGGRITEVEAYLPFGDPACHAFRGKTKRNEVMFGVAGRLYIYLSYGIHRLLNLVCDSEGRGSAVLIRALEPMGDVAHLRRNRGVAGEHVHSYELAVGPGRVGQALGLELTMNGLALGRDSGLWVLDEGRGVPVAVTPRVGISQGKEMPLRFHLSGNRHVSRGAPAGNEAGKVGQREQGARRDQ
jgi:DNA-3-methyladenine glycosylase